MVVSCQSVSPGLLALHQSVLRVIFWLCTLGLSCLMAASSLSHFSLLPCDLSPDPPLGYKPSLLSFLPSHKPQPFTDQSGFNGEYSVQYTGYNSVWGKVFSWTHSADFCALSTVHIPFDFRSLSAVLLKLSSLHVVGHSGTVIHKPHCHPQKQCCCFLQLRLPACTRHTCPARSACVMREFIFAVCAAFPLFYY